VPIPWQVRDIFSLPQDFPTLLLCKTDSSTCSAAPGPLQFILEGVASAQRPGLGEFGRDPCGVGDVMSRLAQIDFPGGLLTGIDYVSARIRSMVGGEKDSAGTLSGPTNTLRWTPPSRGSVRQTAL
jgi:hypothetical protein